MEEYFDLIPRLLGSLGQVVLVDLTKDTMGITGVKEMG
jgi:hypothetical protein